MQKNTFSKELIVYHSKIWYSGMFFLGTLIVCTLLEIFDRMAPGVKIVKVNSDKIEAFWGVSLKSKHHCDLGVLTVFFCSGSTSRHQRRAVDILYLLLLEVLGKYLDGTFFFSDEASTLCVQCGPSTSMEKERLASQLQPIAMEVLLGMAQMVDPHKSNRSMEDEDNVYA